jgi:drug/metabolite transporter (DMT)-like permease
MHSAGVAPVIAERPGAHTAAYAGLTLSTVAWAAAFIAGKIVLAEMTPLPVAAWRYAIAALLLLPFAVRQHWRAPRIGRAVGPLAVMVVCGGVLYPWLFLQALARTSATNAALLIALNPILTLLLSAFAGERLERRRVPGVILALAGAVTVISGGRWEHLSGLAARSLNSGDVLAVAAAANWACFNVAARHVVARLAPSVTNFAVYGIGTVALFALAWTEHPWAQLAAATPAALAGIMVMAILASVVAGQLFLVGVRTVGVNRSVVFVYLVPVLTAVCSVALLGEHFQLSQAVGGAGVLAGVYWTTRSPAAG